VGARTNFVIRTTKNPSEDIVLYSHWGGDSSERDFAQAISKAMARWGDDSYLTIGDHTTPIQAFLDYHLGAMV